ncbi:hypothetical protein CspeluHIS016_0110140 [Cutaneotrichosporon spelunceum]|uniref:Uncharacterized protein n=1 Tax=Cutaneotrichosporon spelunceum TaxID=1672016 RepID=A0AAD3Y9W8_9TREE|nr:hypothetical protein CspeluHIS016_0110140 [Cutaneotrichosporon spelunceum]
MGANLEVFKFATYLFIPIFAMLHFGDPNWYENNVQPFKDRFYPREDTNKPPHTASEVQAELQRYKDERLVKAGLKSEPALSSVLTAVPEERRGKFGWAQGDQRLV